MKEYFYLLVLILSISYIRSNKLKTTIKQTSDTNNSEFIALTDFLEKTSVSTSTIQSLDMFLQRFRKMRKKKEIIIKKVYEIFPLVGELLALSNVEKINLIVNKYFILRESDLLRIYITMLDGNANSIQNSAKILLNLILCNNKFNRLRCILNLLMEGLCQADNRSIEIFKEIVVTVILDTVLKTKFYYMNDLHSKLDLVKIFNKKFKYTPIVKIKFVDEMLLSDKLKEILTFIIMRLRTNIDVSIECEQRLSVMPPLIGNNSHSNTGIVSGRNVLNDKSVDVSISNNSANNINSLVNDKANYNVNNNLKDVSLNTTSLSTNDDNSKFPITTNRLEAQAILNNMKTFSNKDFDSTRFKERLLSQNENLEENFNYEQTKVIDPEHLDYKPNMKIKLNEIKEEIRNEYSDFLYKQSLESMPMLEEFQNTHQIGVSLRSVYPKYRKHICNLIKLNVLLDQFGPDTPIGSVDVSSPPRTKVETRTIITKEVSPGINFSMQFKEKNDKKIENTSEEKFRFKSESSNLNSGKLEAEMKSKSTSPNSDFASQSFRMLTDTNDGNFNSEKPNRISNQDTRVDESKKPNYNSDIINNYNTNKNINNYNANNNKNNYNALSQNISKTSSDKNYNDDALPENNYNGSTKENIVKNNFNSDQILSPIINSNKNIKVLFPKEIHTDYQVDRLGNRTILINTNHPTKKLIVSKLMTEKEFNVLLTQEEGPLNEDPTGLYTVLKNIEGRKCSCGYLCIEIGTIYGNFDMLKPKNITVPYNERKNVHMIIKPIILINTTKEEPKKKAEMLDLFINDDDCDELKLSGNFGGPSQLRFKQNSGVVVKRTNFQRKFYRKVAVGEFVYSKDTFKQGLNLIIVNRDKTYTKIYEKTFDTNNNRKDSEELAEILKNVSCSKLVIVTGIGKWMGAVTPTLIKEIKQIGGPDLNNLYSPDGDDNSKVDHAFILIGRRGLCRFNGIFRLKNYDVTKDMQALYPNLNSDPNDCYFDSVSLENNKNRNSDKSFYHLIDLRLTLNINNDNRFAWDAPTVSEVLPYQGSIHGGQEIKIGGFNFGYHTIDIQEILVRGVICGDFLLLSPNLISCITRASTILGAGGGNVVMKLRNGYQSPKRTCNLFEYVGDSQEALDDLKATIIKVDKMQSLPIYMNSHIQDNNISLFDNLLFNDVYHKEKLVPDHSNIAAVKIDSMVRGNYENLINILNDGSGQPNSSDKFRKRRFKKILNNLEVCNDK